LSQAIAIETRTGFSGVFRDYMELSKARIVFMILITTGAGYLLAGSFTWLGFLNTLFGTALVAGGTNALNQYWERDLDSRMARTRKRPLPAGRIGDRAALGYSIGISVVGIVYLGVLVNPLASLLTLTTLLSYVFIYTPMKTRSTWCTLIGALPGAMPPLIGWAGATGTLSVSAWLMFGLMFMWQMPHFLAIAWIYRDDYARAGFEMVSVGDAEGVRTSRQAVMYSVALLAVSVVPWFLGLANLAYFAGALLSGGALLWLSGEFAKSRTMAAAKKLFMMSNVYLLVIMILLLAGSTIH
jgi:protoheme IX farnesyltransferase